MVHRPTAALAVALVAALLAGCVTTNNGSDQVPEATFRSEGRYGMEWEPVDIPDSVTPGNEETWHLRAQNTGPQGENEFEYRDGCGEPWNIQLTGPDGDAVTWQGDQAQCMGFEEKTFVGGDTKDFEWTWKGQVWSGMEPSDAPAGRYTLTVGFEATHAGLHPGEAVAIVTFSVV